MPTTEYYYHNNDAAVLYAYDDRTQSAKDPALREKREKKIVFKNDIFKVALEVFECAQYIVLFTSKTSRHARDISILKDSKAVYIYNPISTGASDPELEIAECALIVDCLEYIADFMQKANIIKHAFACIQKGPKNQVILIATEGPETNKKDGSGGMEESELTKLLYFAGAKSVTKPETLGIYIETPYLLATR